MLLPPASLSASSSTLMFMLILVSASGCCFKAGKQVQCFKQNDEWRENDIQLIYNQNNYEKKRKEGTKPQTL